MQNVNTFFPRSAQNLGSKKCLYYTPFGVELKGRNFKKTGVGVKDYRFGYQGSEVDNDVKGDGNSYTTEFRQLDPRLGRWLSIDPKATAWESPYVSMGNRPIAQNDYFGDSISTSFISGSASDRAFTEFLNSKEGFDYASKFAAKGQIVNGVEFTKNGEYHNKGIDLGIGEMNAGDIGWQGLTIQPKEIDGRQKIAVAINSVISSTNFYGKELAASKANNDDKNDKKKYKNSWNNFMYGRLAVINHELFIHVEGHAIDYLDDKSYNNSHTGGADDHEYWESAGKSLNTLQNGTYKSKSKNITNLFYESGSSILRQMEKTYQLKVGASKQWEIMRNGL